ncbi:hypothetical protein UNDKW_4627 [Undibacterium sp. KW1]|uniref:energy transducer TonB n=1 Tax=Undibacterium sp. KW1 TaxID=2058624 RepID=UPI001331E52C|nr:energy transducer TonB [Undibacterium sp. KW1]BBB62900.1 hypothetical protein UNDKW_4627 [Undibacterium sp. KW1]
MFKNQISIRYILLFVLLNLNWGLSSAQIQTDSRINSNNAKISEMQAYFSDKPLAFHRCKRAEYPRFALRHEFEGKTEVDAVTDSEGRVIIAEIVRSSGWRLLDETVLINIMGCKIFDNPGLEKVYVKGGFVWKLEGPAEIPAELLTDTCSKSEFVSFARSNEPGRGIVVGVWLNNEGGVDVAELQWRMENKLDQESLRLARSCKFKPASNEKGNRASTISLRFLPLRAN